MDLLLNISRNSNKPNTYMQKSNKRKNQDEPVSFNFTKNKTVKPILAKRKQRPSPKISHDKLKSKKLSEVFESPCRGLVFLNHNKSIDNGGNDGQESSDILLNVTSAPKLPDQKAIDHRNIFNSQVNQFPNKRNSNHTEKFSPAFHEFAENNSLKPKELSQGNRNFNDNNSNRPKVFEDKTLEQSCTLTDNQIHKGLNKFSQVPKKPGNKTFVKKTNLFHNTPEIKVIGQRLVKPITEKLFTGTPVDSINLHPHAVKNLADLLNITELTQVQEKSIPKALEGRDLLVRSQTGSGKTLAYALPIIEKLQEIRPKLTRDCGILAVVIVPTRELSIQVYELFVKLLKPFTWIVAGFLCGGEKRKAEKARLRKGINILVGTPGRLVDHLLHTESFKLDKVKWLVLDEADRLLEMRYEKDVQKIVDRIVETKSGTEDSDSWQRLLLSATLTPAVQKLAGLTLKNPLLIDTSDSEKPITDGNNYEIAVEKAVNDVNLVIPATVDLNYVLVPPKMRLVVLAGLLAGKNGENKIKALVFMGTMEMVNYHHDLMNETLTQKVLDEDDELNEDEENSEALLTGLRFFKLHGNMTQRERSGVFKSFRDAKCGVLLTTDVCGRGIDVPEVDLVVQYSPPQNIADFVHRVGRTARAGRKGRAVLFLGPNETDFVRVLEEHRIRISATAMDTCLEVLRTKDYFAHSTQEAASNLQHKFEDLVRTDREVYDSACKAFVSWVRFFSAFPKDLKHIFNPKSAHMGHYAKSFALQEPPKSFSKVHHSPKTAPPTNRLTYTERNVVNAQQNKEVNRKKTSTSGNFTQNRLAKFIPKSICLATSEFGNGFSGSKKKRFN